MCVNCCEGLHAGRKEACAIKNNVYVQLAEKDVCADISVCMYVLSRRVEDITMRKIGRTDNRSRRVGSETTMESRRERSLNQWRDWRLYTAQSATYKGGRERKEGKKKKGWQASGHYSDTDKQADRGRLKKDNGESGELQRSKGDK